MNDKVKLAIKLVLLAVVLFFVTEYFHPRCEIGGTTTGVLASKVKLIVAMIVLYIVFEFAFEYLPNITFNFKNMVCGNPATGGPTAGPSTAASGELSMDELLKSIEKCQREEVVGLTPAPAPATPPAPAPAVKTA